MLKYLLAVSLAVIWLRGVCYAWIDYPANGYASMTHYGLPKDYIASCGCTKTSTHYPTAAMSQMAYGSSNAFGPACGRCFNLTLVNTFLSDPPFYPDITKSLVIKVTDLCPLSENGWCGATESKDNQAGHKLNFDLAFPSEAIPDDFFPSNEAYYGYKDFGVWNISYESVSCRDKWAGGKDEWALGSDSSLDRQSGCCPAEPTGNANDTCTSYSDDNGLPPDTTTGDALALNIPLYVQPLVFTLGLVFLLPKLI